MNTAHFNLCKSLKKIYRGLTILGISQLIIIICANNSLIAQNQSRSCGLRPDLHEDSFVSNCFDARNIVDNGTHFSLKIKIHLVRKSAEELPYGMPNESRAAGILKALLTRVERKFLKYGISFQVDPEVNFLDDPETVSQDGVVVSQDFLIKYTTEHSQDDRLDLFYIGSYRVDDELINTSGGIANLQGTACLVATPNWRVTEALTDGITAHEIGHTLGLWHTFDETNRDSGCGWDIIPEQDLDSNCSYIGDLICDVTANRADFSLLPTDSECNLITNPDILTGTDLKPQSKLEGAERASALDSYMKANPNFEPNRNLMGYYSWYPLQGQQRNTHPYCADPDFSPEQGKRMRATLIVSGSLKPKYSLALPSEVRLGKLYRVEYLTSSKKRVVPKILVPGHTEDEGVFSIYPVEYDSKKGRTVVDIIFHRRDILNGNYAVNFDEGNSDGEELSRSLELRPQKIKVLRGKQDPKFVLAENIQYRANQVFEIAIEDNSSLEMAYVHNGYESQIELVGTKVEKGEDECKRLKVKSIFQFKPIQAAKHYALFFMSKNDKDLDWEARAEPLIHRFYVPDQETDIQKVKEASVSYLRMFSGGKGNAWGRTEEQVNFLSTANSGQTWESKNVSISSVGTLDPAVSVYFSRHNQAYLLNGNSLWKIDLQTTEDTSTPTQIEVDGNLASEQKIVDISFSSQSEGIIAYCNTKQKPCHVYKTSDGGSNWTALSSPQEFAIKKITSVGAGRWTTFGVLHSSSGPEYFSVSRISNDGAGGGGFQVLINEIRPNILEFDGLYNIYQGKHNLGAGGRHSFFVGENQSIVKIEFFGTNPWVQRFPTQEESQDLHDIAFAENEKTGIAVGEEGIILISFDGGKQWRRLKLPDGGTISSVD
ncbi:MAG: M12 family metallo-peptidase, partial [Cytophagales bacterium]|nr:M12 family metallo-peptidase [Cytophagales bacterium]